MRGRRLSCAFSSWSGFCSLYVRKTKNNTHLQQPKMSAGIVSSCWLQSRATVLDTQFKEWLVIYHLIFQKVVCVFTSASQNANTGKRATDLAECILSLSAQEHRPRRLRCYSNQLGTGRNWDRYWLYCTKFPSFLLPQFFFLKKSSQPMCAYDKCTLLPASKCSQSKQPGFLPLQAAEWMRKRSGIPGEVL